VAPGLRRVLLIGALVLLAAGATWAASAVSYEDNLAAEPSAPSTSPAVIEKMIRKTAPRLQRPSSKQRPTSSWQIPK
jgi:hypothetical protein